MFRACHAHHQEKQIHDTKYTKLKVFSVTSAKQVRASAIFLSPKISLLSVIHTIYSIMQTNIQGLHVSTVYGHLQAVFLN